LLLLFILCYIILTNRFVNRNGIVKTPSLVCKTQAIF
jgi:hypothetical protein